MEDKIKKVMALAEVLKRKVKRRKERLKDLEVLIDSNEASSRQKQEYVQIKAEIDAYEDAIDLAEGMIETE